MRGVWSSRFLWITVTTPVRTDLNRNVVAETVDVLFDGLAPF